MLSGDSNDKDTLVSAVRLAAREGARLRIVLATSTTREACEKHLDFATWDVQQRLHLHPPDVTIESHLPELDLVAEEVQPTGLSAESTSPGIGS